MKSSVWGDKEKEYGHIKPYLQELTRLNPGSSFFYETDAKGHFVRCGFTPPFAATFLNNAIPAMITDMAHLRNQKFPGQLSQMVGQDGNHNILPLTWGLHSGEDEAEWSAVFDCNRNGLDMQGYSEVQNLFLLGDADKGMAAAGAQCFPDSLRFRCTKHMATNLAQKPLKAPQEIRYFYTCAAMGYTQADWDRHMQLIEAARPDVYAYILAADPSTFARSRTPIHRFDLHTNGDAESMNAKFVDERALPRYQILQEIELAVMQTIQAKKCEAEARLAKMDAERMHFSVTPWAETRIKESLQYARTGYEVAAAEEEDYFVVYTLSDKRTRWLVNLSQKHCTCGRFTELQIPCVHALAVLTHKDCAPHTAWSLCNDVYKTENWAQCYSKTLTPVNVSELVALENCLPPVPKKQRGRPKSIKRKLGADERPEPRHRPVPAQRADMNVVDDSAVQIEI